MALKKKKILSKPIFILERLSSKTSRFHTIKICQKKSRDKFFITFLSKFLLESQLLSLDQLDLASLQSCVFFIDFMTLIKVRSLLMDKTLERWKLMIWDQTSLLYPRIVFYSMILSCIILLMVVSRILKRRQCVMIKIERKSLRLMLHQPLRELKFISSSWKRRTSMRPKSVKEDWSFQEERSKELQLPELYSSRPRSCASTRQHLLLILKQRS